MTNHSDDKTYYDNVDEYDPIWAQWANRRQFSAYSKVTLALVERHFPTGLHTSLELGAGTCSLSLSLSHLLTLERLICMDISRDRMQKIAPVAAKALPRSRLDKIEQMSGSFNERLPFADQSLDLVLFDASLHHAASIWDLLQECRRILKPSGLLIAQREQYLGLLSFVPVLRRLLRTSEVQSGVIENAFLRAQYEYYFKARGFEPRFIGVSESAVQSMLRFANGFVFSKWVVEARPT